MSKRKKRLEKLRRNPNHASKEAVDQVLHDFGYIRREGKGSHTVYQHPDRDTPIVVAAHGKDVPAYIVKQVLAAIDAIVDENETDEDDDNEND